jgi:hypothetical protein
MSPGRSDSIQKQQIVGDLVFYQNDGKDPAIAGRPRESVSGYSRFVHGYARR